VELTHSFAHDYIMIDIFILMIHIIVITYWITLKYSLIVNKSKLLYVVFKRRVEAN